MSDWFRCPACDEREDITTVHDTLYVCDACEHSFNPRCIYG